MAVMIQNIALCYVIKMEILKRLYELNPCLLKNLIEIKLSSIIRFRSPAKFLDWAQFSSAQKFRAHVAHYMC